MTTASTPLNGGGKHEKDDEDDEDVKDDEDDDDEDDEDGNKVTGRTRISCHQ